MGILFVYTGKKFLSMELIRPGITGMISEGIMTIVSGIHNFRRSGRPGGMHPVYGSVVTVMLELSLQKLAM